jgi:4-hydroxy-3-polyprenylbenzoate decarboxylase/2,5-furandicarboxylate decarboxylase 1
VLKDLRSFLDLLEREGDLVRIERPVSPLFEVAAGIRKTSDIEGPALYFSNVTGSSMPIAGGLYAHRRRVLLGLETTHEGVQRRFTEGPDRPIEPRLVGEAPCKEVILTGDDADLGYLPNCTYNKLDAGPFITMGLQIANHPDYGRNVSISRMQIFDGKHAGVLSVPPQTLGVYFGEAEARGEPLEVAVAIGNDPYSTLASQIRGNIFLDELTVAGGWMGEPVDVIRCETIGVEVPATSEIVLEGEMIPGERREEGPFGEVFGYYGSKGPRPVFRLKAITHRRDPIYLAGLTGRPNTDNHVLRQIPLEALLWERLREICPTLRDVTVTRAGAGLHVVVSIKPTYVSQARDVMLCAMTTERIRPKLVTMVDEDIDPRDPQQVEWASVFRVQADRDVVIIPRAVGHVLDPSTGGSRQGAVMGIDATVPFGEDYGEVTGVPGAETFEIPGWT